MNDPSLDVPTPPEGILLPPGQSFAQFDAPDGQMLLCVYIRVQAAQRRAVLQVLGDIDGSTASWFGEQVAAAITAARPVACRSGRAAAVRPRAHRLTA